MVRRLRGRLLTGAALLWAVTATAAEPVGEAALAKPLADLIVYHVQGWGALGVDAAAHAPGTEGMPLQIGETTYGSGLGVHARAETVLLLEGRYQRFEAVAGVQRQPGDVGTVVMQAFVDGEQVFDSGPLRGGASGVPVRLDVRGASELRLTVEDGGDGINGDLGNWADARLTPDPDARGAASGADVDMARFATVKTWDPGRLEGTTATRLEPIPAEELFLGREALPDADGAYTVPKAEDGRACIGLEWLERRRLKRIELTFAAAAAVPDDVAVQFWRMGYSGRLEGGSRWQGQWLPLGGEVVRDGATVIACPDWTGEPESRSGTLKVRWVLGACEGPVRIAAIRAYTASRFEEAALTFRVEDAPADAEGTVEIYNGSFTETEEIRKTWRLSDPLTVGVRYAAPRPWQVTDRTVLRFRLPDAGFGVAADDVVGDGPVYVAHAGLLASTGAQEADPAAYRQAIADRRTVIEETRTLPEQTVAQALERVYIPESSFGETMLSLANDNRKIVLRRNGAITFESDLAMYESIAGLPRPYPCELTVRFGSDRQEDIARRLEKDWLPIVVIERKEGAVTLRQRTFMAPVDEGRPGAPAWLRERALGVAEYTIENGGDGAAVASFGLALSAQQPEDAPTTVRIVGDRALVEKGGKLLAAVVTDDRLQLSAEDGGAIRVEGALAAGAAARCAVYLPFWENARADETPSLDATASLARRTEAYWRAVTAEGMQAEVPDELINNLIPASVMHIMMAARNDEGRTVAPWIATLLYGPWDSEAHSVIRGMHTMGQMDFARRGLEYFIERYNEDGYFTTGYTVLGTGWHLWTLGEYYAYTKDAAWLREVAPEVARVCRWVMAQREKTKRFDAHGEKVPEYGLMPPGVMADWDAFNYYFYLNAFYYAGLQAAGAALADIGWPGADDVLENAAAYKQEIRRAFAWVQERAPVVKLRDGRWTPFYPTHVYSPSPIENLYAGEDQGRSWCYDIELGSHHLTPLGVLDPHGPQTDWIINHMEDVQFLRPGWGHPSYADAIANQDDWFNLGGFSKVQPYYARTGEIHALRDDVKPFLRTYFNSLMSLLNKEDLAIWEHFVGGSPNKTHETGYFLHQSRLMLVQERGEELWLAPFIPSAWLEDGKRVVVRQAPTLFGELAYGIASHVAEGYVEVRIEPPTRTPPKAVVVRLRHPQGGRLVRAEAEGARCEVGSEGATVRLEPTESAVTVRAYYD